ncbi:MAG: uncharacterized protein QOE29_617 [Gaiellaceae bacterium]|nr:uncharacterized protein [Gaiellaceae bacterium]
MRDRLPLLAGLVLLALSFLLGSLFIAGGIRDRGRNDTLAVTGSAKAHIVSDYAIWTASVTAQDGSAGPAGKRVSDWSKRIVAFLQAQGVRDAELTSYPISTSTVNDDKGNIRAYQVTRSFEVRSSRVDAVSTLADASSTLILQGVPLSANPVQYVYTKLASLRPKLLQQAVADARKRAQTLVDATGAHLGKARSVAVGVFQITAPNSTEVSDYGVYDTSTLRKDVTAVVNLTFGLN